MATAIPVPRVPDLRLSAVGESGRAFSARLFWAGPGRHPASGRFTPQAVGAILSGCLGTCPHRSLRCLGRNGHKHLRVASDSLFLNRRRSRSLEGYVMGGHQHRYHHYLTALYKVLSMPLSHLSCQHSLFHGWGGRAPCLRSHGMSEAKCKFRPIIPAFWHFPSGEDSADTQRPPCGYLPCE